MTDQPFSDNTIRILGIIVVILFATITAGQFYLIWHEAHITCPAVEAPAQSSIYNPPGYEPGFNCRWNVVSNVCRL